MALLVARLKLRSFLSFFPLFFYLFKVRSLTFLLHFELWACTWRFGFVRACFIGSFKSLRRRTAVILITPTDAYAFSVVHLTPLTPPTSHSPAFHTDPHPPKPNFVTLTSAAKTPRPPPSSSFSSSYWPLLFSAILCFRAVSLRLCRMWF